MSVHSVTMELIIDFKELRVQKEWLINNHCGKESRSFDGLLNLIDSIQDSAIGAGVPEFEVFGFEEVCS